MRRLALLVFVLPLAACGGGGGNESSTSSKGSLDSVNAAVKKTDAAGSASVALKSKIQLAGQQVALSGAGAFRTTAKRAWLKLDIHIGSLSTPADEVLLGTSVYVRAPLITTSLPHGKTWLKFDLSKLKVPEAEQLLFAENPFDVLQRLQSLSSATKVGTGVVDGVSATHYRVEPTSGPLSGYDVWVGRDGYIHRVVVAQSNPKVSLTADLSGYGRTVTVDVPPAAQVYSSPNGSIPGLGGLTS